MIDRLRRMRAISFDGDMALWNFETVMRHSLNHALAELRRRIPEDLRSGMTIDRMITIRNAVAKGMRSKALTLTCGMGDALASCGRSKRP